METKFTPGPWVIDDVTAGGHRKIRGHRGLVAVVGNGMDWPEVFASDANLIAAAPEMLSELQKQVAWLQHIRPQIMGKVPGSVLDGLSQSVKYMNSAIAKAIGTP